MSSRSQRPVSRHSSSSIFYTLAIGAGVLRTASVTLDVAAVNTVTIGPVTFGFMSQWVSFIVTVAVVAILSIPVRRNGKKRSLGFSLDPDFARLGVLPRKPMLYVVLSGLFAGISTASYYTLIGSSDASSVLPFGQLVIIYLLIGDLFSEKDTPTMVELQCVISILFGVLLVGVTPGGFDIGTLLLVLGPLNVSSALFTYYQRQAKRYEIRPGLRVDTLNMRVWSLLFLNIVFSLYAVTVLPVDVWEIMAATFEPLFWLMVASSVTTFLSLILYVRALARGSMAIVNSLSSISVVLGIPVTLIGNTFIPGAFGAVTGDVFLWTLRVFGVILVMIGVVALEASDVRSIVLIKVCPLTGDLLPDLFAIKGVETAAALAGEYDYLLTIKSRSLGKTRKLILRKVQQVAGVKDIETLVVLRDYR
ncbi:MAG: Lrp/AsnC ligand binding domain-containing protein [Candidatus Thorarchaeota archaeon]